MRVGGEPTKPLHKLTLLICKLQNFQTRPQNTACAASPQTPVHARAANRQGEGSFRSARCGPARPKRNGIAGHSSGCGDPEVFSGDGSCPGSSPVLHGRERGQERPRDAPAGAELLPGVPGQTQRAPPSRGAGPRSPPGTERLRGRGRRAGLGAPGVRIRWLRAEPCRAVPSLAEPRRAEPYEAVLQYAVPCRAHAMQYRAVPHHSLPSHTVPCRTVPCRSLPAARRTGLRRTPTRSSIRGGCSSLHKGL